MKATLIVTHEVKDVAQWKKVFDEGADFRAQMGAEIKGVYAAADKPNQIIVVSEVTDLEQARAAMSTPEFRAVQERGGIIAPPEVRVLQNLN